MLTISKSTICGITKKPLLVIARGAKGTFFDAIEAGAVFKSYTDAEVIATFPINKKLKEGEHDSPPKGYPKDKDEYAGPGYTFPVDTKEHTKAALALFSKHDWSATGGKKTAAKRILRAAKKFGIEVNKDDDVYKAAKD